MVLTPGVLNIIVNNRKINQMSEGGQYLPYINTDKINSLCAGPFKYLCVFTLHLAVL